MSSTQQQLIKQCATRLRGIVEALDNIHDSTPHRWSTDLDDVHSSAESLLALINDQAPAQDAQGLAGAALAQPSPAQAEQPTADDYEEVLANHRRLVREMDVLLNGEEGAAKQASLCDLVGQVSAIVRERRVPLLSPSQAEAERLEGGNWCRWSQLRQCSMPRAAPSTLQTCSRLPTTRRRKPARSSIAPCSPPRPATRCRRPGSTCRQSAAGTSRPRSSVSTGQAYRKVPSREPPRPLPEASPGWGENPNTQFRPRAIAWAERHCPWKPHLSSSRRRSWRP